MNRQRITIAELKETLAMDWRPVCAGFAEDSEGNPIKLVQIDFICEWRIADHKFVFVEVPFETQQELQGIAAELRGAVESYRQALLKNFAKLQVGRRRWWHDD